MVDVEVVVAVVAFAVYVAEIALRLVEERESGWEDKESRCVRSLVDTPKINGSYVLRRRRGLVCALLCQLGRE